MLDFAETGAAHTGHEGVGALLYGGGVIPYFREKTAEGEEVFGLGGGFDAVVEYVAGKGEHIEAEGVGAEILGNGSRAPGENELRATNVRERIVF